MCSVVPNAHPKLLVPGSIDKYFVSVTSMAGENNPVGWLVVVLLFVIVSGVANLLATLAYCNRVAVSNGIQNA